MVDVGGKVPAQSYGQDNKVEASLNQVLNWKLIKEEVEAIR